MCKFHMSLVALLLMGGGSGYLLGDEVKDVKLDEVVVSATGFAQNIKDAPASISVINQKEIEKKNHKDLADIVKDSPGVFAAPRNSSMKGKSDIRMRDMDSKYTKILIGGR